jgi:coproporphyrinogen III oxidase-like Fe-S oxidoreductase
LEKNILPEENVHQLSADEAILEFIMLGLRAEGIDIDTFNGLFKSDFLKKYELSVKYLIKEGYAFFDKNKFKLNETGYAITDEIVSRYF